jgi:hypothetical protein
MYWRGIGDILEMYWRYDGCKDAMFLGNEQEKEKTLSCLP